MTQKIENESRVLIVTYSASSRIILEEKDILNISTQHPVIQMAISTRPFQFLKLKSLLVFLCATLFSLNSHGQWLDDYCYRKAITINASQVSGTGSHADFPVMISLSNDNDIRSRANAGLVESSMGNDIRFADITGVNLLDFEIEEYDAMNGNLVAWVRIPSLSATTNTVIYLYFGNPVATAYPNPENTWNANYLGVWHTNADIDDATSNGNDGVDFGPTTATGIAGGGLALDGVSDYIQLPDIDANEGTFSFWMNLDSNFNTASATSQSLVSKYNSDDNYFNFILCGQDNASYSDYGQIYFNIEYDGLFPRQTTTTNSWTAGTWYYVTGRWGWLHSIGVNGTVEDTTWIARQLQENSPIEMGRGFIEQVGAIRYFDGIFDEIRISDVSRSDSWLATEQSNLSNPGAFRSIGSLEDNPPSPYAGIDDEVCGTLSYFLSATDNNSSTGQWSYVSGQDASPVFFNATSPMSEVMVNQYGTYVFRWTETNGSCSTSDEVVINFQEKLMGQSMPEYQEVCSGEDISEIAFITNNGMDAGTTFTWNWVSTGPVHGIPDPGTGPIIGALVSIGGVEETVTFTIVPTSVTGCQGDPFTALVVVHPMPMGEATPAEQTVCSYMPMENIRLVTSNGMDGMTTFSWIGDNITSLLGMPASGTGDIHDLPFNFTQDVQMATYTITPTSLDGCQGDDFFATVTVIPEPQVFVPFEAPVCHEEFVFPSPFWSPNTGGTIDYTWINTDPSIGLPETGSGEIPPFMAFNFGPAPVVAMIEVFPNITYDGLTCEGPSQPYPIIVNPSAQVFRPADQVICNMDMTQPVTFFTDRVDGTTTYDWFNDNPSIGLATSGSGDIPSFPAINFGTDPIVATIFVIPHYENGGPTCEGPGEQFTITVNPTAEMDAPLDLVAGHNENITSIIYTSPNTGGMTSYSWTNDNPSIGLAGSGTGEIPSFVTVNTNPFQSVATITVTPEFTNSGISCWGPSKQFSISVNPSVSDAAAGVDQDTCGTLTTYLDGNIPSIGIGIWSQVTGPGTVVFGDENGYNSSVTCTLYGSYVLRWTINLDGQTSSDEVEIIFREDPRETSAGADQELCGMLITTLEAMPHTYQSGSEHPGSTTLWNYVSGADSNPVFSNATSPTSIVTVSMYGTYVFRWTETNGGCATSDDVEIRFDPPPDIFTSGSDKVICNNTSTNIDLLTTDSSMHNVRYTWTVSDPSGHIDGETNSTGNGNSIDQNLQQTLFNWSGAAKEVVYTIYPHTTQSDSSLQCVGNPIALEVWVNPTLGIGYTATDGILCNEGATTITVLNPNNDIRGTWMYDLEVIPDPEILGSAGNQTAVTTSSFTETLSNTDTIVHEVRYHLIPRIALDNGGMCENGEDTLLSIWVNPTPEIRVNADTVICNGETASISIRNPNFYIRGTWKYDLEVTAEPEIAGVSGSGIDLNLSVLNENLVNTDQKPHYVDYRFIPKIYNEYGTVVSCDNGLDTTIRIWVNPTAHVDDPSDQVLEHNENTTPVIFISGTQVGTVTYSWINDTPSIGLAASGMGDIPSFIALNTDALPVVATITVTPEVSNFGISCTGPSEQFSITVNPLIPDAEAGPDQDKCGILVTGLEGNDPMFAEGTWTQLSGTGTIDFGDIHSSNTSATATLYGTYVLRWTITLGDITSIDEVTVDFHDIPNPEAGANQTICSGESVTLNASGGIEYVWDGGVANGTPFIPTSTQEYHVIVTDENGCSGEDQVWVEVKPIPLTPTISFDSDTLFSDSDIGNQWYMDEIPISDAGDSYYLPGITGTYHAIVTEDGCVSEKSNQIYIQATDIKQHDFSSLKIFPNPTQDFILIETENLGRYILEITASTGQLMRQEVVSDPVYSVNLSQMINGIYFITIKTEDFVKTERIIKF